QQLPLARLEQFSISNSSFDLQQQKLLIGQATSSKLEAWAQIDAEGVSNWQKLLPSTAQQPATANSSPAPDSTVQANKDKDTSPAWRILVKQADFKQQKFHLEDLSQSQPVVLELADFNLKIKDFDSQANSTFNAELDTQVGEHGKLSSNATVTR